MIKHKNTYISKKIPSKVILWGGTGQAKLVRPIIEFYGARVVAVFDDTPGLKSPFSDVKIYQGCSAFKLWFKRQDRKKIGFCIAIGNPHGMARLRLHDMLMKEGLSAITIAHQTAWVAENVIIGAGTQIMAGAIITEETRIGRECLIDTNANVDHESVLNDGVEIAPGATLCGLVQVGINAWVGAGATVLPRIKIGKNAIVGAGSVVTRDVPNGAVVIGNPAMIFLKRKGES